jgi:hypothetical protein
MTSINLRPAWITEDGSEPILPAARYYIRPLNTYASPDGQVLNIFGPPIPIAGAQVTVTLDASSTGAGPYQFQLRFRDIEGNDTVISQYSTVPDDGTFNLEDLVSLDPLTLTPAAPFTSADHDALVALIAQVGAMSGGATNLAGISDMSAFSRTANTKISAGTWRTQIGAGTSSLVTGTILGTAADGAALTTLSSTVAGHTTAIGGIAVNTTAIATLRSDAIAALALKLDSATAGAANGVARLDANGRVTDASNAVVAGVGNVVMIFGASSARTHPQGGYALPTGTSVIWVASSTPTNMTTSDIWINDPSA